MIHASQAFRDAVRQGKPQRAVLRFDDGTFTNEDISITSGGITFYERLNEDSELTIGSAPSSSLRVALVNTDNRLEHFSFGRFTAAIGACVEEGRYTESDLDGKSPVDVPGRELRLTYEPDTVTEWWDDGTKRVFELVKLGTFIAPRPAVLRKRIVDLEADDQMAQYDEKMAKDLEIQYPITLGELLEHICQLGGVTLKTPNFLNSDLSIAAAPEEFEEATVREVIAWIAEAAAGYARFDREGQMEIVWFSDTEQTYDEHDYQDFTPYSYQVQPIDRLNVRNQNSDKEAVLGEGENAYMIQNNPFLRQDDSAEGATIALAEESGGVSPIYDRLSAFPAFNPSSAELFTDWSVQAGDVVSVRSGADTFSVPVYSMTMTWNGAPKITLENSGEETREPLPEMQRQSYGAGRGAYQEKKRLDGLQTWAHTNVDELNARIDLDAGAINELTGWRSEASIAIDGLQAAIALTASKESVDELTGRVEQSEAQLVVQAGQISSKVSAGDIASAINQTAQSVLIQADKIDLQGYVTATQLEAAIASFDYVAGGFTVVGSVDVGGYLNAGGVNIESWGYFQIDGQDAGLGNAIKEFGEASESGGKITIPTTTLAGLEGSPINFNIADTQFYKDGVSAAASRVVIDMNTLETLYNSIQNSYEIRATLSNRNPVRISVPATEAYEAGAASVTLNAPTWDSYIQGDGNTFTVTASNGESVSQGVYLSEGSWSNGSIYCYLRTDDSGSQLGRLRIWMPDSGTWGSQKTGNILTVRFTVGGKTYTNNFTV